MAKSTVGYENTEFNKTAFDLNLTENAHRSTYTPIIPYFEIYCLSVVLLGITAVVWVVLWILNARGRWPARYFTVLVFTACNIVSRCISIYIGSLDEAYWRSVPKWIRKTSFWSETMQDLCLVAHVFFWLATVKRQVLGWAPVIITLLAAGLVAILLVQLQPILFYLAEHEDIRFKYPFEAFMFLSHAVPIFLLGAAVLVIIYCIYRLFIADKTRTRDLQIARWSCVATLPLVVYSILERMFHMVYRVFGQQYDISRDIYEASNVMNGLYVFFIFLVFVVLNVELLALTPCLRSLLDCEDNQQDHFKDAADKPFTESEDPLTTDVITREVKDEGVIISELEPINDEKCNV